MHFATSSPPETLFDVFPGAYRHWTRLHMHLDDPRTVTSFDGDRRIPSSPFRFRNYPTWLAHPPLLYLPTVRCLIRKLKPS